MRYFVSTPAWHPSARPNARQKCGSSKASFIPATQVESVSLRVHAEHSRCAPDSSVSIPSEPLRWYPPSTAFFMASWIVIGGSPSPGCQAFLTEHLLCVLEPLILPGFHHCVITKGLGNRLSFGVENRGFFSRS